MHTLSRVIGYIDGFNLYGGMKERCWYQYYWISPYRLIQNLLAPGEILGAVKYFSARVRGPDDRRNRQSEFLNAIRVVDPNEVILGKFYKRWQQCRSCKTEWATNEEKMTDSAIASHLVADAFRDQFDTAFLVGGDTDIVPAVKMVRRWFPQKRLHVWFPPARTNQEVADNCHDSGNIMGNHLAASLMPDEVRGPNGVLYRRPPSWSDPKTWETPTGP